MVSYYLGLSRTFHAQYFCTVHSRFCAVHRRFCTVHSGTATVLLGSTSADYYVPEPPRVYARTFRLQAGVHVYKRRRHRATLSFQSLCELRLWLLVTSLSLQILLRAYLRQARASSWIYTSSISIDVLRLESLRVTLESVTLD